MNAPRIPVTVLTGFLGAGKTTLLNAVLSDPDGERVAVIVNEYGEAGLDHDLIESADGNVALMQSGCLCCSLRGELSQTMAGLISRREAGELDFERVVIETTGLADPGPILQTLRTDPVLARSTRMDGVVTVVDAANGPATLDSQFEAVSQVAMADLIVLSKTDLVTPSACNVLEDRLRALNACTRIVKATRGQGAPGHFWAASSLRETATPADLLRWTGGETTAPAPLANLSGLNGATPHGPAAHDARIVTASIVIDYPVDTVIFDDWMASLLSMRGPNILRAKGILFLDSLPYPFVFHGVQHIFDAPVPLKNWAGADRKSRIVLIARDIPPRKLQRDLERLRARPLRPAVLPTPIKGIPT